jgi:hypothetical protein
MWSPGANGKYGHRCFGKIRKIFERTGILLTHDEITFLCENLWNCNSADEFYAKMDSMSTDELKDWARKAKKKKAGGLSDTVLQAIYV